VAAMGEVPDKARHKVTVGIAPLPYGVLFDAKSRLKALISRPYYGFTSPDQSVALVRPESHANAWETSNVELTKIGSSCN
jgi:hypothetical protein